MAHLMGAEVITHEFPTKEVFSGVTVGINDGDRIGIVGRNGDGKSTLVKILTKQFAPDSGRVHAKKARLTSKNMRLLRAAVQLAQKVGARLGGSALLLQAV